MTRAGNVIVHCGRVTIRRLCADDAAFLHRWLNDPAVLRYYEGRDRPHSLEMVNELH